MEQKDFFGRGIWLTGSSERNQPFYILRGRFQVKSVKKATLNVLGLGFFHCYINGKAVSEDEYLPLSTDYEQRENWPAEEIMTGHRIYVPQYDITGLLDEGENIIAIHFGGGWYTADDERYGIPKAIWNIKVETEEGEEEFCSSEKDKICESYIESYNFCTIYHGYNYHESQDLRKLADNVFEKAFDDFNWENAVSAKPLDTNYLVSDCPADRFREELPLTKLSEENGVVLYDIGKNCSAVPFVQILAPEGESVSVEFYEALTEDGKPDEEYHQYQHFNIISDGKGTVTRPMFLWYGFRYITVPSDAKLLKVCMLSSDVEVTSGFQCDSDILNWLYDAFVNTQLSNMHTGIPSDCPHMERRGYTGDGQLICHAAMDMLDGKAFYNKWIYDISDCQDIHTGHVQYTAPYTHSGGGPGGWGCAIIEVPYQYYKHYGDKKFLKEMYGQMLRYFDYLEAHSENALVISDKEGEWCLGDWCPPEAVVLPAPYVNNYFYIKSLNRMIEIAELIGKEEDIPLFEKRIEERKHAIMVSYFNKWDSNFLGNVQGANAFAVDIGLGDARTYQNLVNRYNELGEYDTGIFGTDVLTRVLFENGDGEVAVKLMNSSKPHSFGGMKQLNATTLWEYWPESNHSRSLNHPMFGAVSAYLFDYILGIKQKKDSCAYENIVIAPVLPSELNYAEGYRTLPCGKVSVRWEKAETCIKFVITLPEGVKAGFCFNGIEKELQGGENVFTV